MESIESLLKFTSEYPQVENNALKYSFTGGVAIRLNQEISGYNPKREMSDIDIVTLDNSIKYPVHSFYLGGYITDSLSSKEILNYICEAKIKDEKIYFMDGA
ncbi:MAG: hypothetical protein Q8O84_03800, partial [Nanoarchaeota archaeon]|nr:hypothetical protein [Nanoarchaeota archaeon]